MPSPRPFVPLLLAAAIACDGSADPTEPVDTGESDELGMA